MFRILTQNAHSSIGVHEEVKVVKMSLIFMFEFLSAGWQKLSISPFTVIYGFMSDNKKVSD